MKPKKIIKRVPKSFIVSDYVPGFGTEQELRKWCIERSIQMNDQGTSGETILRDAEKIYNWVKK